LHTFINKKDKIRNISSNFDCMISPINVRIIPRRKEVSQD
jgi:hypothetical protein